jgi:hypothetical protein
MDSLSYVVAKTDFFATTDITIVSIRQITAQQGQRETMATELVTRYAQFLFIADNAECSEQLSPGIIRKMFELTAYHGRLLPIRQISQRYSGGDHAQPYIESSKFAQQRLEGRVP